MSGRGLRRYLDDLLAGRRPRPFRATQDDAAQLRLALELRAARPSTGAPSAEFIDELHRRLAAELATAPDGTAPDGTALGGTTLDGTALGGTAAGPLTPGPPATEPPRAEPPLPRPVPLRSVGRRRLLLQGAGLAAASAAVGAAADHALTDRALTGRDTAPDTGPLAPTAGAWQTVAASTELPEGTVRAFDLGTVAGFVHRAGGVASAVSGSCTHQGCRLRLDAARNLDCPCHTTVFAASGELITHQLPIAPRPLPRFATREVDGAVQVFAPPPQA